MIIKGNARSDAGFWAAHLMRVDHNEHAGVIEIRGLSGRDVRECLTELEAITEGTRTKNGFYVASLNPREDEELTAEQWRWAADRLERELGLEGQPRLVVEHVKDGRTHHHVVWGRIDADTMKAIPADFNYQKHEQAARAIEAELGLSTVESVLVKDRKSERPDRRPKDWEGFRAADTKIDPQAMKAELTALYEQADSGLAFKAALEDAGYLLARGDRRDFVVIDPAADDHSLARRISGAKTAEIRARLADIDRESLPSVAEARELMRARMDAGETAVALEPETDEKPEPFSRKDAERQDAPDLEARQWEDEAPREASAWTDEPQGNGETPAEEPRRVLDDAPEPPPAAELAEAAGPEEGRLTPWGRALFALSERASRFRDYLAELWERAEEPQPAAEPAASWVDYVTQRSAHVARAAGELWRDVVNRSGELGRSLAEECGAGETPFAELEKRAARWLIGDEPADDEPDAGPSLWEGPDEPKPASPEPKGLEPDEPDYD